MKTPAKKAHFIKRLMDKLTAKYPKRVANKVMLECGYMMRDGVSHCINEHRIENMKQLFKDSKNLEDFVRKFGKHSGGRLAIEGNIIRASYDRCYCGSVSQTKEEISLTYCYCGAGWYKRLFQEVLGKPVGVKILRSIASGADTCELEIRIK